MDDMDVWRDAMQRALDAGTHEERAALVAWATEWRLGTEGAARPAKPAKRGAAKGQPRRHLTLDEARP